MNYWLFKSEPDDISIDDLKARPARTEAWVGIRNYQARNFIRDNIKVGDRLFFYHSSCKVPGIAGVAEVVSSPYADPSAFDPDSAYFDVKSSRENPKWYSVDIGFIKKYQQIITLNQLKSLPALHNMYLIAKGGRLSVQPVTEGEWLLIDKLGKTQDSCDLAHS